MPWFGIRSEFLFKFLSYKFRPLAEPYIFRRDSVGKLFVFEILFYLHLAMKRAHEKLPAGTPWKELRLYTSSGKLKRKDGALPRSQST